jgi:hypothetical protein
MKMISVFACGECNAATIIAKPPLELDWVGSEIMPLKTCDIVRDSTPGTPHDPCRGTVEFVGGVLLLGGGIGA